MCITRYVQELYAENFQMLIRKRKDLDKWRNMLYSRIERLSIIKMLVLPELLQRFNTVPIKIPARLFYRCRQGYSKMHMARQKK